MRLSLDDTLPRLAAPGVPDWIGADGVRVGWTLRDRLFLLGEDHVDATALVLVDIAPRIEEEGAQKIQAFMGQKPDGFDSLEEVAEPRPTATDVVVEVEAAQRDRYHVDVGGVEGRNHVFHRAVLARAENKARAKGAARNDEGAIFHGRYSLSARQVRGPVGRSVPQPKKHRFQPSGSGPIVAMESPLRSAGITQISYVGVGGGTHLSARPVAPGVAPPAVTGKL